MIYLATISISLVLYFAELSLIPHLLPWFSVPFLLLPFISIYSLKDRTIFPIFLAGLMGVMTDAATGNQIPIYSIAYLSIAVISKIFLGKFNSYGEVRANLINMLTGITIIYGTDLAFKAGDIYSLSWFLPFVLNVILAFAVLVLYIWVGRRFFTWIEKETEERFR